MTERTARDGRREPYVEGSSGNSTSSYGYGWSIVDFAPDVRVVTHNGGNGIFFGAVPVERLREAYAERKMQQEEEFGPLRGYEVLGTGCDGRYYRASVRFRHERCEVIRAYAWDRAPDREPLGVALRRTDATPRLFRVVGGRLGMWDAPTGRSILARLESAAAEPTRLVLSRGSARPGPGGSSDAFQPGPSCRLTHLLDWISNVPVFSDRSFIRGLSRGLD